MNIRSGTDNDFPLIVASFYNHPELVRYLLSKGARVDQTNSKGYTALAWAVFKGNARVVKVLVKEGRANLDILYQYDGDQATAHTPSVFCAVGARPPRPATRVAATTASTATTAITGVVRLCNATRKK